MLPRLTKSRRACGKKGVLCCTQRSIFAHAAQHIGGAHYQEQVSRDFLENAPDLLAKIGRSFMSPIFLEFLTAAKYCKS